MRLGRRNWWDNISAKDRIAIVVAGTIVVGLVVTATIFIPMIPEGPKFDPQTFCPEEGVRSHTIVIFDRTDAMTPSQIRAVTAVMDKLKVDLREGEKLSVHEIDPGEVNGLSEPLFSLCKPPDGSSANSIYENPRILRQRFEKKFGRPLEEMLSESLRGGGANRSPIMESLFDVALLADFGRDQDNRWLVIFSDLLQHTASWSQYGSTRSFKKFFDTPTGRKLVPYLSGVKVKVYYLLRFRSDGRVLQDDAHIAFWERYFEAASARVMQIQKVR